MANVEGFCNIGRGVFQDNGSLVSIVGLAKVLFFFLQVLEDVLGEGFLVDEKV